MRQRNFVALNIAEYEITKLNPVYTLIIYKIYILTGNILIPKMESVIRREYAKARNVIFYLKLSKTKFILSHFNLR